MRILIVEDEAILALDLSQIVEDLGHSVIGPARDVESALKLAETETPEFALLDLNLGDELSTPIAAYLATKGVPFTFLSGYSRAHFPEEFASAPAISKPCSPQEVQDAIRNAGAG